MPAFLPAWQQPYVSGLFYNMQFGRELRKKNFFAAKIKHIKFEDE